MKKLLSIVLAVLMLFSTVSYAAPSMADVVATVEETVDTDVVTAEAEVKDEAALAAESDYGTLVYDVDFDNPTETVIYKDGNSNMKTIDKYGKVNLPAGFPAFDEQEMSILCPTRTMP